jgi:hypothetical protein
MRHSSSYIVEAEILLSHIIIEVLRFDSYVCGKHVTQSFMGRGTPNQPLAGQQHERLEGKREPRLHRPRRLRKEQSLPIRRQERPVTLCQQIRDVNRGLKSGRQ